jgi:hypothetical protein
MQNYTEQQLVEMAESYFAAHPTETKLFATTDGNFFLEADKSHATYHAYQHDLQMVEINQLTVEPIQGEELSQEELAELETLKGEYEQLFGKKPAANIGKDTLLKRIQDKKAQA